MYFLLQNITFKVTSRSVAACHHMRIECSLRMCSFRKVCDRQFNAQSGHSNDRRVVVRLITDKQSGICGGDGFRRIAASSVHLLANCIEMSLGKCNVDARASTALSVMNSLRTLIAGILTSADISAPWPVMLKKRNELPQI